MLRRKFNKWQSFLQSSLSNSGQAIASYKEAAAPIVQVGSTTVTQLCDFPRKCGIAFRLHTHCLEAHTCDLPQDHLSSKNLPAKQTLLLYLVLEKGYFWVIFFPYEHNLEKQSEKLYGS